MKDQLSALDLFFLVKELQQLQDAKVEKVFGMEKPDDVFLFSLHSASLGKSYLYASLPGTLCVASFKPDFPTQPPHFVASLRRKITNARIQSIEQVGFERILKITLTTKLGISYLYFELFTPGNIVLTDEAGTILATRHHKTWNDKRIIRPGKTYVLPEQQNNPQTLSLDEFSSLIKQSDKEELVKFLAIECSLGGIYAEEVLTRASIEKTIPPTDLSDEKIVLVYETLSTLFNESSSPTKTDTEVYPFTLQTRPGDVCTSFAGAIAENILTRVEKEEKKEFQKQASKVKNKYEKIIQAQEAQLKGLEEQEILAQQQGELIYSKYSELSTLLENFQIDLKKMSAKEIQKKYEDLPFVKAVNMKEKSLTLEIENE